MPAMKAEQGMVRIQATMMRSPQIQRTERTPLAEPTPRIAPVMAWVVETGTPWILVKPNRAMAAALSAQNPPTGWRRVMEWPRVLTIRQPPKSVPRAMAAWQVRMIHQAMLWTPPPKRWKRFIMALGSALVAPT